MRSYASKRRPENIGPNTSGPQIAPETTAKSTIDMPRARRSGGNISAAAARESSTIACAAPHSPRPRKTSTPWRQLQPAAVTSGPDDPEREARADDGHPADAVGQPTRRPDGERAGDEEHGRAEAEDAVHPGDGDDRHRPERDGELDHPRQEDEPEREQQRVPPDVRHVPIRACSAEVNPLPVEVAGRWASASRSRR